MKKNILSTVVIILSLTLSICCLIVLFLLWQKSEETQKNYRIDQSFNYYDKQKLLFCLNNKIPSCGDASLTAWNSAHPDKVFKLESPQELTETGIDAYSSERK